MDASKIFKAEFVGAVGAVPRTCFLHLSLRLLARSYRHFRQLRRALAADLRCRILTRPPASVRPYIEPHSICQDQVGLKPNRIGLHAFPCCSAADAGSFRQHGYVLLPALFWQRMPSRPAPWRPIPPPPCATARRL